MLIQNVFLQGDEGERGRWNSS